MQRKKSVVPVVAATLLMPATLVYSASDEADKPYIEEIVVTAERRDENILTVPTSITAFDAQLIEDLGMTNRDDLEQLVPSLQFGDDGEKVGQGTVIRGIGSRLAGETHADLAVATYVDGVYTADSYGIAPNLFDVERVEVARGPQGTLHGRNSIGGSVSYFSKKPTDTWEANILTEFTDQTTQRYNFAFGGPITDSLMFRITGGYHEGDGAQENVGIGEDYDAPDERHIAPQLRFKMDRWDVNLRYSRTEDKGTGRTQIQLEPYPDTTEEFYWWGDPNEWYLYPYENPAISKCAPGEAPNDCDDLQNKIRLNRPAPQDSLRESITLSADFNITETLTLRYTFGDSESDSKSGRDTDRYDRVGGWMGDRLLSSDMGLPFNDLRQWVPYLSDESSHELILMSDFDGPFNFITGAYYYENETSFGVDTDYFSSPFRFSNSDDGVAAADQWWETYGMAPHVNTCQEYLENVAGPIFGLSLVPTVEGGSEDYWDCPPGNDHTVVFVYDTAAEAETKAVFASADYQINDNLLVSGGLRYTEDTKKQGANRGWYQGDYFDPGIIVRGHFDATDREERTWDDWIWDVSAEYTLAEGTLAEGTMIFGHISTGYRAGAFNTAQYAIEAPPIDKETLINYEFGWKGLSLDGRLQIMASVFYSEYDGFQVNYTQYAPEGTIFPPDKADPLVEFTDNIDGTTLWGGEIEFVYQLTERVRLSGYYAYLDSELGSQESIIYGDPDPEYDVWPHVDYDYGEPPDFMVCTPEFLAANPDLLEDCQYQVPSDNTGNQLAMQPNHKAALTAAYTVPLSESPVPMPGTLQLLTTYSYTGSRYPDIGNFSETEMSAYGRWDIRANWVSDDNKWAVVLFVQNVLDEIGLVEYLPLNTNDGLSMGTLTEPRQVGISVQWRR